MPRRSFPRCAALLRLLGCLVAKNVILVAAAVLVIKACDNAFFAANSAFITDLVDTARWGRWFGLERAVRNAGLGLGAVAGGVIISGLGTPGYEAIILVNAASCGGAALLVLSIPPRRLHQPGAVQAAEEDSGHARSAPGYLAAVRDPGLLIITGIHAACLICDLALALALPIFVIDNLHAAGWLPGVLIAINTGLVVVAQTHAAKLAERFRKIHVLGAGIGLWAISFAILAATRATTGLSVSLLLLLFAVVFTIAEITYSPTAAALPALIAPADLKGRYIATFQLCWTVAGVVAPYSFTLLLSRVGYLTWIVMCVVMLAALSALPLLRQAINRRDRPNIIPDTL